MLAKTQPRTTRVHISCLWDFDPTIWWVIPLVTTLNHFYMKTLGKAMRMFNKHLISIYGELGMRPDEVSLHLGKRNIISGLS